MRPGGRYPDPMLCRTRYRCQILADGVVQADVVAVFEEGRDPDEWGDPGRLIYRKLVSIEGKSGPAQLDQLKSPENPEGQWATRLVERIGGLNWAGL